MCETWGALGAQSVATVPCAEGSIVRCAVVSPVFRRGELGACPVGGACCLLFEAVRGRVLPLGVCVLGGVFASGETCPREVFGCEGAW